MSRSAVPSSAARGSADDRSAGVDPFGRLGEGCGTPIQIVAVGLRYFAQHFAEPGALVQVAAWSQEWFQRHLPR